MVCIQHSDRGTGNCMGEARPGYQHCEAFFFWEGCLVLLPRVLGKLYKTVKPYSSCGLRSSVGRCICVTINSNFRNCAIEIISLLSVEILVRRQFSSLLPISNIHPGWSNT